MPDGRYVHIWKANATSDELVDFAATFVDQPTTFNTVMAVRVAPDGFTPVGMSRVGDPNSLMFASVTLCPPGVDATSGLEGDAGPACLRTEVFRASDVNRAGQGAPEQRINVDGLDVHVVATQHLAYAVVTDELAVIALAPANSSINTSEMAALVASVQFDPALASKH